MGISGKLILFIVIIISILYLLFNYIEFILPINNENPQKIQQNIKTPENPQKTQENKKTPETPQNNKTIPKEKTPKIKRKDNFVLWSNDFRKKKTIKKRHHTNIRH
jgi:hypothetical protein